MYIDACYAIYCSVSIISLCLRYWLTYCDLAILIQKLFDVKNVSSELIRLWNIYSRYWNRWYLPLANECLRLVVCVLEEKRFTHVVLTVSRVQCESIPLLHINRSVCCTIGKEHTRLISGNGVKVVPSHMNILWILLVIQVFRQTHFLIV